MDRSVPPDISLPGIRGISLDAPSPLLLASRSTSGFPCSLSLARPSRRSYAPCGPSLPVALGFQLAVRFLWRLVPLDSHLKGLGVDGRVDVVGPCLHEVQDRFDGGDGALVFEQRDYLDNTKR